MPAWQDPSVYIVVVHAKDCASELHATAHLGLINHESLSHIQHVHRLHGTAALQPDDQLQPSAVTRALYMLKH